MPNATNQQLGTVLAVIGEAGGGKSQFAIQSPQPHAILCVDKPAIATLPDNFPGYDPALSLGKFYPPPDVDLTDDKALPPRNVFDQIWKDVYTLRTALYKGVDKFEMGDEVWLLPRTIIIEGADFVRSHAVNWVLNVHHKQHMDEFLTADGRPNVFLGWGLVAEKMIPFFKTLTFLPGIRPVNVIVTIGVQDETQTVKNNGKVEQVATGKKLANFEGKKLAQEAPRSFVNLWLASYNTQTQKYYINTKPKGPYGSLRSGRVGVPAELDVTIDPAKPVNYWNKLIGG